MEVLLAVGSQAGWDFNPTWGKTGLWAFKETRLLRPCGIRACDLAVRNAQCCQAGQGSVD